MQIYRLIRDSPRRLDLVEAVGGMVFTLIMVTPWYRARVYGITAISRGLDFPVTGGTAWLASLLLSFRALRRIRVECSSASQSHVTDIGLAGTALWFLMVQAYLGDAPGRAQVGFYAAIATSMVVFRAAISRARQADMGT